jgi:hypothetical protein
MLSIAAKNFPGSDLKAEVGRPLFWSAGPLSTAQQTTEMIADQQTGKNSGPALVFRIFWPIFKNISRR